VRLKLMNTVAEAAGVPLAAGDGSPRIASHGRLGSKDGAFFGARSSMADGRLGSKVVDTASMPMLGALTGKRATIFQATDADGAPNEGGRAGSKQTSNIDARVKARKSLAVGIDPDTLAGIMVGGKSSAKVGQDVAATSGTFSARRNRATFFVDDSDSQKSDGFAQKLLRSRSMEVTPRLPEGDLEHSPMSTTRSEAGGTTSPRRRGTVINPNFALKEVDDLTIGSTSPRRRGTVIQPNVALKEVDDLTIGATKLTGQATVGESFDNSRKRRASIAPPGALARAGKRAELLIGASEEPKSPTAAGASSAPTSFDRRKSRFGASVQSL